jgi:hypothetical protein
MLLAIFVDIKDVELVNGIVLFKKGKDSKKESSRKLPFHDAADGAELMKKLSSPALGLRTRSSAGQPKHEHSISEGSSSSGDVVVQMPVGARARDVDLDSDDEEASIGGEQDPLLAQRNMSQKRRDTKANSGRRKNKTSEKSPLLPNSGDEADDESSCCKCCCVQ